jgi:hypothetical protein
MAQRRTAREAPIFWTGGGKPVSPLGRTGEHGGIANWAPRPQGQAWHFRTVRALVFSQSEDHNLLDLDY